ncbi:Uncharacterised protein [Aedoeadaptatus ivorii]|uniref:Uncharacterized protein n=1 Tax=Aedoeadaptatus ivorii TaxID=54006 RepID=A0A448UZV4_9FIRM|nr:Uncharacterised protein [Peptoniphilus ivorii]
MKKENFVSVPVRGFFWFYPGRCTPVGKRGLDAICGRQADFVKNCP